MKSSVLRNVLVRKKYPDSGVGYEKLRIFNQIWLLTGKMIEISVNASATLLTPYWVFQ